MRRHIDDVLLCIGLSVIIVGVALFDYRVAVILAGACVVGVAAMRAYTHAE